MYNVLYREWYSIATTFLSIPFVRSWWWLSPSPSEGWWWRLSALLHNTLFHYTMLYIIHGTYYILFTTHYVLDIICYILLWGGGGGVSLPIQRLVVAICTTIQYYIPLHDTLYNTRYILYTIYHTLYTKCYMLYTFYDVIYKYIHILYITLLTY